MNITHSCPVCERSFVRKDDLHRHISQVHEKVKFKCNQCDQQYSRKEYVQRHERSAHGNARHMCSDCKSSFGTQIDLNNHIQVIHNSAPLRYPCPVCPKTYKNKYDVTRHCNLKHVDIPKPTQRLISDEPKHKRLKCIRDTGVIGPNHEGAHHDYKLSCDTPMKPISDIQPESLVTPNNNQGPSFEDHSANAQYEVETDPLIFNPDLIGPWEKEAENLISKCWRLIRTHSRVYPLKRSYNYRLPEQFTMETLINLLHFVCHSQTGIYKINAGFGQILKHKTEKILRYWHTEKNATILDQPMIITSKSDLQQFGNLLRQYDPRGYALRNRPNTEYELYATTNITFFIYPITTAAVGVNAEESSDDDADIRQFIKKSKSICCLYKDVKGKKYTDNLCFFRCLTSSITQSNTVKKRDVEATYFQWMQWCAKQDRPVIPIAKFPGVDILRDISDLEDCFKCNIFVYQLVKGQTTEIDYGDIYETLAEEEIARDEGRCSSNEEADVISAQMLVRSMKIYEKSLYLNLNFHHFSLIRNLQLYVRWWRCHMCDRILKRNNDYSRHLLVCTGGVSKKYPGGGYGNKLSIFAKLRDEGIEVCRDDQFYPYRIVYDFECRFEAPTDPEGQKLVFEDKLIPVSVSILSNLPGVTVSECFVEEDPKVLIQKFYQYLEDAAKEAYRLVSLKYETITNYLKEKAQKVLKLREEKQRLKMENVDVEEIEYKIAETDYWCNLHDEWQRWLKQVPVVSFNGSRFDLNLIRHYLVPLFIENEIEISPITRGSAYLLMSTSSLSFLDVTNFLAAGTSYSKWLAAFGVEEKKSIFCYEWLTSFDKLEQKYLPPKDAFYSQLKQKGISDSDYKDLQKLWISKCFQNMKDYLIYYNCLDTGPFMVALNKMCQIFKEMGIDMLKSGNISLPGLAQIRMFQDIPPDTVFQIFNEENKEYRELVNNNIVGGPSIIFKRRCVAGEGSIKGTGHPPKAVFGFDANGLYLWSLAQNMPTGLGRKWETEETGHYVPPRGGGHDCPTEVEENMKMTFKQKKTSSGLEELIVVNYIFKVIQAQNPKMRLSLRHKFNGTQKIFRVGKSRLPVDGWIPELRMIIQYHGCFWHGHNCRLTIHADDKLMQLNAQKTRKVQEQLATLDCRKHEIRQCQFYDMQRDDPELAEYAKSFQMPGHWRKSTTARQIIQDIRDGKFFGMVEVDIQVPYWKSELRVQMKEFTPIFKNTDISIDDTGEHMAQFARENNILTQPRRALVGSYFAEKMFMATPLVKWYLDHNLVVTRVYRALQYQPKAAFAHLPEEVAFHRRRADENPSLAAYGQLFKLMGNAYYGKCLTSKEKHLNVKYNTRKAASKAICSPHFKNLEPINQNVYEVHMVKAKIVFDLPINIAYFVYAYAKLRMLEFYYDFLVPVLTIDRFELAECDTDSLYFSTLHPTFEETIPKEKWALYEKLKHSFLVITDFDKKTPGLFKLEWFGMGMICLSSKTYIAFSMIDGKVDNVKLSTKGINKATNEINVSDFEQVIQTRVPKSGVNRGFRMNAEFLWKYRQERVGLTYFYIKRKVLSDGISTEPLDL